MANKGLISKVVVKLTIELYYPSFLVVFDHIHKLHKTVDKLPIIADCSTSHRRGNIIIYTVEGHKGVGSEAILQEFMKIWQEVFVDVYGHLEV